MAEHRHQYRSPFGDTTYTKVFVGGLAWETPTDRMRDYFQQFGDILEAVIIADKNTGNSKGYGFVTFRDPESAARACEIANPMIDGRRANCNIASLGRTTPPASRVGHGAPSSSAQAISSHAPANPFYFQSSYGYTPYGYGYGFQHQAMYNAQQGQYGYGYGYPMPNSRPAFYPARAPSIYYSSSPAQDDPPSSAAAPLTQQSSSSSDSEPQGRTCTTGEN